MRRTSRIGASLGLVYALSPALALAADGTNVALMPVAVEGELPQGVRDEIAQRVVEALESDQFELVEVSPPGGECPDFSCIHGVARHAEARYVVVPSVGTLQHDYGIAVRIYDAAGSLKISEETTCEICSHGEAVETVATQAQTLKAPLLNLIENPYGDRPPASREVEGPTQMTVRSRPSGALVKVDGKRAGETPLTLDVEPGVRSIELKLRGHLSVETTVRAIKGENTPFETELLESDDKQNKALRTSALAFGIAGIPVLAGGITLLAFHRRPVENDCSGDNVDFNGTCRYRYNTVGPGAALTAVGIASVIVGITTGMIYYSRKKSQKSALDDLDDDHVQVTPILGPTSAGVKVRF